MSKLTPYQKAVASHMEDAPKELKDYVCERLKVSKNILDDDGDLILEKWINGSCPINYCGFDWDCSEEGEDFWCSISEEYWDDALVTEFWKRHTGQLPTDYNDLISKAYDSLKEKQLKKNADYGDSLFQSHEVMGQTINPELGVLVRIADKLKRLNSKELQTLDESYIDTIDDLIGYLIALKIIKENEH